MNKNKPVSNKVTASTFIACPVLLVTCIRGELPLSGPVLSVWEKYSIDI